METSTRGAGVAVRSFGDVENHAGRGAADLIGKGAIVAANLRHHRPHLLDDREGLAMNLELHGKVIGRCRWKLPRWEEGWEEVQG